MARIRKLRVMSVAVPVALMVVAGTAWADPVLAESMGLDVWEIGRLENDLKRSTGETTRLDTELLDVKEMTIVNEIILQEVIDGRVDLSSAAKRKWDANKHRVTIREHLDWARKGSTYEERMAHDLVVRVRHDCQGRPDYDAICHRLEQEFEAAYHVSPEHSNR